MLRPLILACALVLSACASKPPIPSYSGPEVTQLYVSKKDRRLYLMHDQQVLKTYPISLGFDPVGAKSKYADGKTPEGTYYIDRRNLNSAFYLSLGISYPNPADVAKAKAEGVNPGGDIFIHGEPKDPTLRKKIEDWQVAVAKSEQPSRFAFLDPMKLLEPAKPKPLDWTAGCIAVTDDQIREIFSMVKTGTPIFIAP